MEIDSITAIVTEVVRADPRHVVRSVSLFGSQVSGHARPDSDVDLLVDFDDRADLFDLGRLQYELEQRLGRPVDLVTPASLSRHMKPQVLAEAVRIYG